MTSTEFIHQFNSWPEHIKKKIQEYADKIFKAEQYFNLPQEKKKIRQPGCGKGIFLNIPDAEEFNKPLDDLKDYM